jgi:hypothetical protein
MSKRGDRAVRGSIRGLAAAFVAAAAVAAAEGTALAGDVEVLKVAEHVFVRGGTDADKLVFSSPETDVLRIAGFDELTTVGGEPSVDIQLRPRESIYVLLGDGDNEVTVESAPRFRRLVVLGGADNDALRLTGTDLRMGVLFVGGNGQDTLELGASARLAGELVAAMGEGSDTFSASQATLVHEAVIDMGNGEANTVLLDQLDALSTLTVIGGAGDDSVEISGGEFHRYTQVDLGAGDDALSITAAAQFDGAFVFRAGDDTDSLTVDGDAVFMRRALFDLGRGDDGAGIGAARFVGPLRVVGGDGDEQITLSAFSSEGRMDVLCGAGADQVTVDDANPFTISSYGARVHGGEGHDTITGGAGTGAAIVRFEVQQ